MFDRLINALLLQSGYNVSLVTVGAALLGIAAGSGGAFLFLRKRALVSDAVAHATLPGVCVAFMVMVVLGGDGRNLAGLLFGSAVSAGLGLLLVEWIARRTRLAEDAAIGAILSVFFGLGIVLLTVIQALPRGKQAGLESFLLGSTAGMLMQDAVIIALGGALAVAITVILRRQMTLVSFDPEFASATGIPVRRIDLVMMGLVMGITVIGLKVVGLILIVAMLIIPPVAARFWTHRVDRLIWIAGATGGASGYLGAAISASAPQLPTGPIIVLVCFFFFLCSLLLSPQRGVLAAIFRYRRFQLRVHRRQGLLSLAHNEPIFDPLTLRVLRASGFIRKDRTPTPLGWEQAAKALRDEKRWDVARRIYQDDVVASRFDSLAPIDVVFTGDEIAEIDRQIEAGAVSGGKA